MTLFVNVCFLIFTKYIQYFDRLQYLYIKIVQKNMKYCMCRYNITKSVKLQDGDLDFKNCSSYYISYFGVI